MESGFYSFDLIKNETLLRLILSEASPEEDQAFVEDWKSKN
jgi:hypothetical protein